MPLITNPDSAIDDTSLDCIKFLMHDVKGMTVFCIVTAQALRDLSNDPDATDLKRIFFSVRNTIEGKASAKYDFQGGTGGEVIVTNSD
jgi:hypothetical protein